MMKTLSWKYQILSTETCEYFYLQSITSISLIHMPSASKKKIKRGEEEGTNWAYKKFNWRSTWNRQFSFTFLSINVGVSSAPLSLSKLKTLWSLKDLKHIHRTKIGDQQNYHIHIKILWTCNNKNMYFSSFAFVSFFLDLTLATVSKTAW